MRRSLLHAFAPFVTGPGIALAFGAAMVGASGCKAKPTADADAGAASASAASVRVTPATDASAAIIDDPFPPRDPSDPDARMAVVLLEKSLGGWDETDHALLDRATAEDELARHDAACAKKVAASCTIAALGHADHGEYPVAQQRAVAGCGLDDKGACGWLVSAWFESHLWGGATYDVDLHPRQGESDWEAALRNAVELCDGGIGFACHLAARAVSDARFATTWSDHDKNTMLDRAYELHVRGCALASFAGCRAAVDEITVGGKQGLPDRPHQIARLTSLATRLCERRAGSCANVAELVGRLGPPGNDTDARRKALIDRGCAAKADPTWTQHVCDVGCDVGSSRQ